MLAVDSVNVTPVARLRRVQEVRELCVTRKGPMLGLASLRPRGRSTIAKLPTAIGCVEGAGARFWIEVYTARVRAVA